MGRRKGRAQRDRRADPAFPTPSKRLEANEERPMQRFLLSAGALALLAVALAVAGPSLKGAGDVEAAQFGGGFIVFYFFNPMMNQFVYFVWPVASVAPQVVNNAPDANGTDEQNVNVDVSE